MDVRYLLLYILVAHGVVSECCVTVDFEGEFNTTFSNEVGVCVGRLMWNLGHYHNLPIESPDPQSFSYVYPNEGLSCVSSFSFPMASSGVLEVKLFMEPSRDTDQVTMLVNQIVQGGNDAVVGNRWIIAMDEDFVSGWRTERITLTGFGSYDGYISLLGMAANNSIILIDSFRYIPPGTNEDDCVVYEVDTTSTITTRADIMTTDQENSDSTDIPGANTTVSSTTDSEAEGSSTTQSTSITTDDEIEDTSTTQSTSITTDDEIEDSSTTQGTSITTDVDIEGSSTTQSTSITTDDEIEGSSTTQSTSITTDDENESSWTTQSPSVTTDGEMESSSTTQSTSITTDDEIEGSSTTQGPSVTTDGEMESSSTTQSTSITTDDEIEGSSTTQGISLTTDDDIEGSPTTQSTSISTDDEIEGDNESSTSITTDSESEGSPTIPITAETEGITQTNPMTTETLYTSPESADTTPHTTEWPNTSLITSTEQDTPTTDGPTVNPGKPVFWFPYTITMVILLILLIIIITATVSYLIGKRRRRRISNNSISNFEFVEPPSTIIIPRVQKVTSDYKIPNL